MNSASFPALTVEAMRRTLSCGDNTMDRRPDWRPVLLHPLPNDPSLELLRMAQQQLAAFLDWTTNHRLGNVGPSLVAEWDELPYSQEIAKYIRLAAERLILVEAAYGPALHSCVAEITTLDDDIPF